MYDGGKRPLFPPLFAINDVYFFYDAISQRKSRKKRGKKKFPNSCQKVLSFLPNPWLLLFTSRLLFTFPNAISLLLLTYVFKFKKLKNILHLEIFKGIRFPLKIFFKACLFLKALKIFLSLCNKFEVNSFTLPNRKRSKTTGRYFFLERPLFFKLNASLVYI